jgi:hypothetical protein
MVRLGSDKKKIHKGPGNILATISIINLEYYQNLSIED